MASRRYRGSVGASLVSIATFCLVAVSIPFLSSGEYSETRERSITSLSMLQSSTSTKFSMSAFTSLTYSDILEMWSWAPCSVPQCFMPGQEVFPGCHGEYDGSSFPSKSHSAFREAILSLDRLCVPFSPLNPDSGLRTSTVLQSKLSPDAAAARA